MYFWLFLNIASDDTKILFAAFISPPEAAAEVAYISFSQNEFQSSIYCIVLVL
jgi:hypothetical protein